MQQNTTKEVKTLLTNKKQLCENCKTELNTGDEVLLCKESRTIYCRPCLAGNNSVRCNYVRYYPLFGKRKRHTDHYRILEVKENDTRK